MPSAQKLLAFMDSPLIQSREIDAGFSLPELLLGISLGLVVLGAALTAWQNLQQTWLGFVAQQNLQHNTRAALQAIVSQAELSDAVPLLGVGGSVAVVMPNRIDEANPAIFALDNAKGGDTLRLSHWRSADGTDCQGNTHGTQAWVRSQFQRSTSTPNDLACKDLLATGSTYQAIAEGVEDFQVLLAEVSVDNQRLQWKSPTEVIAWSRVVAIEMCLRLASPTWHTAARSVSVGCAGETVPADGRLRQWVRRVVRVRHDGALNTLNNQTFTP